MHVNTSVVVSNNGKKISLRKSTNGVLSGRILTGETNTHYYVVTLMWS
jgi:hypothetical protein